MGYIYTQQYVAMNNTSLSPNALRILLRMSAMVRDDAADGMPEGLYFNGWKNLTVCVGGGILGDDDPIPKWVKAKIAAGLKELRTKGLVEIANTADQQRHWNRVYRLKLPTDPAWWS